MILHHVEIWVPSLTVAESSWGWLLTELGWTLFQDWPGGRSRRSGSTYLVFEESPARRRPVQGAPPTSRNMRGQA
jgi:hypothetical protein